MWTLGACPTHMSERDRISFGTDGWRDQVEAFTPARVRAVGDAVAQLFRDRGHSDRPVAVGFDARESSPSIAETLAQRFERAGFEVRIAQRDCPTPAVASEIERNAWAGGVMVTASHNPPAFNGIKVIPAGGAPALPETTDAIESLIDRQAAPERHDGGSVADYDFIEHHVTRITDAIDSDLSGTTIAYDAMHGSGRGVTDRVLRDLNAEVEVLRCTREAEFGGANPEPTAENLETLLERVASGAVDLGLATDGDADRIAAVTQEGLVNANKLFALMYEELLERAEGPAVRTVSTSFLIDRIAHAHDESVVETAVGFKWVAEAMAEHDALIGGEESGGFTVRGHVREKDGPYAGALLAAAHARQPLATRLERIADTYGEIHQRTHSIDCPQELKQPLLDRVQTLPPEELAGTPVTDTNDVDGLKCLLETGSWLLVRPSGTEPKFRIYAEADSQAAVDSLIDAGVEMLDRHRASIDA